MEPEAVKLLIQTALEKERSQSSASLVIDLNLFRDTVVSFSLESVERTTDQLGWILRGPVGLNRDGFAILTIYQGALSGSVRLASGEHYQLFIPTSGIGEVEQNVFRGYSRNAPDYVLPDGQEATRFDAGSSFGKGPDLGQFANAVAGGSTIDVLVAYTTRAKDARGGTAGMLSHINQVLAESNTGLANSNVDMNFRLVHAVEVSWDDSQTGMSYNTALAALRSSSDGNMDQLHSLRDQYGADIVSLFVSHPLPTSGSFTVGLAYMLTSNPGSFAPYGFSVVHQNYAGGSSLTFPHEVGHNMGLNHDAEHGGSNGGLFPDSQGYQQETLSPKFFTIMAYSADCSGCSAINYFSNPNVSYQGIPTGVAGSIDAARTLEYVRSYASNWRAESSPSCSYSLGSSTASVGSSSGSTSVSVSSSSGCSWTAVSNTSWITVTAGASGSANGTVSLSIAANTAQSPRTGTVTIAGNTFTVQQAAAPAPCSYTLNIPSVSLAYGAGSANVSVSAGSGCNWTAVSSASWITVTAGASGSANGIVSLSIAANTAQSARTGTVTIAGNTFTVQQAAAPAPCSYTLNIPSVSLAYGAGSANVSVSSGSGCNWTTVSSASWITVTAGASGSANGIVSLSIAANTAQSARTGTVTIAGNTFTVQQAAAPAPCSYTLNIPSVSLAYGAGSANVSVSAGSGCNWTAVSSASWITVTAGASGSANGIVSLSIAANTAQSARTGTVTIAGSTFIVQQAAAPAPCVYTLSGTSASAPYFANGVNIAVSAGVGCSWTTVANAAWITVTAGATGSGSSTVSLSIAANPGQTERSGTVTIAGNTFTVQQAPAPAPCTYSLSSNGTSVGYGAGTATVSVIAGSGCGWNASSGANWITIASGSSGSGNGTVTLSFAENPNQSPRSASIVVAGVTYSVQQAAAPTPCGYALNANSTSVGFGSASVSVTVTAGAGCGWTASSNAPWISIGSGASGSANGSVSLVIAENTTQSARTGSVTIGGQFFTVQQAAAPAPCSYSITPGFASVGFAGGSTTVSVSTTSGCGWAASSNVGWISISGGANGSGSGSVSLSFGENPNQTPRSGTVTVAGQTFTIQQAAAAPVVSCSFAVNTNSISVEAGASMAYVQVTAGTTCGWSATSNASWLKIVSSTQGTGSSIASVQVQANPSESARTGTVSIAGHTVTVSQSGTPVLPNLTLSPGTVILSAPAGATNEVTTSVSLTSSGKPISFAWGNGLPGWLQVTASGGVTPATLTLSANPQGLAAGTYSAIIPITSSASANPAINMSVSLRVEQAVSLRASPRSLSFSDGFSKYKGTTQLLRVKVSGASSPIRVTTTGGAWLSATAEAAGSAWLVRASANPADLGPGVYDGEIAIDCLTVSCEAFHVPVRFQVTAASQSDDSGDGSKRAHIASGGIVNAGSFQQGIASGSWMSIFGEDLATESRMWQLEDFDGPRFPRSVGGVHVTVDGKPAAIQFVSPNQLNFQAPDGLSDGWVSVEVTTPYGSDQAYVYASKENPGFFQIDGEGQLAALHADGRAIGWTPKEPIPGANFTPAKSGEVIAIFGTGFGPTDPKVDSGELFQGAAQLIAKGTVQVLVGGAEAKVDFVGLSGAGLNQLNITLPTLPRGTHDVLAVIDGAPTQFAGKIAIE